VEDGVKEIINDCLYPKEESLASHIKNHLKVMVPEKMKKYEQATKWNILWRKIEEKVNLNIHFYYLFRFILINVCNCLGWIILLLISW